jgi:hypothetical protein
MSARQAFLVLLVSGGLAFAGRADAQHVDPDSRAHAQDLTFALHPDSTFPTATADSALVFGTRLLQRCDDPTPAPDQDVACGVTMRRSGAIGSFGATGDGLDVITTQAEMDTVIANPAARIKVVTSISACGGQINPSIIGCGYVGAVGIVSESGLGINLTGEELDHEFGHNQGLGHRGDPGQPPAVGNPILENPLGGRNEVNILECAAYHSGGVDIGANTPVNFPPNITCPSNRTVQCSATGGTPAGDPQLSSFFSGATAEDGCEPAPTITHNAPSLFPVSVTTPVTFTATDPGSLTDTCSATVRVVDTTQPDIKCPANVTVECTGNLGVPANDPQLAPFFAGVSASDVCDATPTITNNAPGFFGLGATTVQFRAVDDSGNQRTCTATVTVQDTHAPTISLALDPTTLWPPNHRLVPITAAVTVTDTCDPGAGFVLTSITSNQPDNDEGDGDTPNDVQGAAYGTADTSFLLRAERSPLLGSRIYTVVYTASDSSSNGTLATAIVVVPRNQGHPLNVKGATAKRK